MVEPEAWIAEAKKHQDILADLIRNYHPRSVAGRREPMSITAPGPEAACDVVRAKIRAEGVDLPDPVHIFSAAVDGGDHSAAYSIVSQTWFGVPESTSAWSIPGFAEAVDLLDDPPETDADEPYDENGEPV